MNPLVSDYLKEVLSFVKYRKAHSILTKELYDHIECIKEECCLEGMDEGKAYEYAIRQMGEPDALGKQLYRQHKPKSTWLLFLPILALALFGMYSSYNLGRISSFQPIIIYLLAGIAGFLICYFIDFKKLQKFSYVWVGIGILFLLFTYAYGVEINGARRWFQFGPVSVKTVAFAIPLFLIGFAGLLAQFEEASLRRKLVIIGVTLFCVILTMINFLVEGIVLYLAIYVTTVYYIFKLKKNKLYRRRNLIGFVSIGVASILGFAAKFFLEAYRLQRLQVWLHPDTHPLGYRTRMIRTILKNSSWLGDSGLQMVGKDAFSYGIEDYSLLGIVGNLGILAGILTVCVIVALIICSFLLSRKYEDRYGNLLLLVISTFYAIQAVLGIFTQLELLPISTLSIPFLSYDGSSIVFYFASMGFFLGIALRRNILPSKLLVSENK